MDNKTVFAKNLNRYMKESGKTRNEICQALGFSYYTFSDWCTGKKYPRMDKVEMLANYFGIQKSDLIEEHNKQTDIAPRYAKISNLFPIAKKRIPFLGEIACGKPVMATEEKELYVEAGAEIQADFCLRAKGDSMIGARILDGDIVFIRKQDMVENGDIAAIIINDETTLKRVNYFPEKNLLILKAENPKYEDLIYMGDQLNSISILGKAVAFTSDVR